MLLAVIQHLIETKQLQAAEHLDDAGDELAAGIIVHDHHDEARTPKFIWTIPPPLFFSSQLGAI